MHCRTMGFAVVACQAAKTSLSALHVLRCSRTHAEGTANMRTCYCFPMGMRHQALTSLLQLTSSYYIHWWHLHPWYLSRMNDRLLGVQFGLASYRLSLSTDLSLLTQSRQRWWSAWNWSCSSKACGKKPQLSQPELSNASCTMVAVVQL